VITRRKKATNKQFRLLQKKLFNFCRRVKNIAAFGEKRTGGITRAFLRVPKQKNRAETKKKRQQNKMLPQLAASPV